MADFKSACSQIEYDAILFDLDGTLLDTADDLGSALNTVLNNHQYPLVSSDIYRPAASNGAAALLAAGFKASWEKRPKKQLIAELLGQYEANIATHTHCFRGIEQLIIALDNKAIPWGIMTNKPGFLTTPLVKAIPALKSAHVVVSGDTLAESKPSPLPLLYCAQLMNVNPKRCLYVGDAQRDIAAGKAAGMKTATALWGYIPSYNEALSWQADFNWQTPIDAFNHI